MPLENLKKIIRNIPDFPKPGIQFKDITPILSDPAAFRYIINSFSAFAKQHNVTAILAPEARGFIFAAAIAYNLGIKFVPARKPNKLPYKTYQVSYDLEYGNNILEIHQDGLLAKDRVLIIDDLIATSGTINACIDLVKKSQAKIACIATLISLTEFKNQQKFDNIPFLSLIDF